MKKASVRDLRCEFKEIERLLLQGEEIQITKRGRVIARLVPESEEVKKKMPDFRARMRKIFGDKSPGRQRSGFDIRRSGPLLNNFFET